MDLATTHASSTKKTTKKIEYLNETFQSIHLRMRDRERAGEKKEANTAQRKNEETHSKQTPKSTEVYQKHSHELARNFFHD